MRKFFLLRHTDVNLNSGTGCVAQGVIFDQGGMCSMTWLTPFKTVTVFDSIVTVKKLHGHDGKTEVIIEGVKKDAKKYEYCLEQLALKKSIARHEEGEE
jgi:hypothetical protein